MSLDAQDIMLLVAAALLAGAVNAAAGGGSLISFPMLLLIGLPALAANVTNTVALCPGYLGGTVGYRSLLDGQGRRMRRFGAISVVGAAAGVAVLELSSSSAFRLVVPFLLLLASTLLIGQRALARLVERHRAARVRELALGLDLAVFATAVYGAYFGAAMGVLVLAVFGVLMSETMQRLNALKSYVSLVVNVIAAILFAFVAPVHWEAVAVMMPASLIGGRGGAALARHVSAGALRAGAAAIGTVVAALLLAGL
ncbi:MAG: sulfite exporter TauE/SafE family protein [Solirubrobacteraceae bacterium]